MNKIIYPNKDEISRQISDIIDKSELFKDTSEDEDVLEYTEFAPINRHKNLARNVCACAAVAAVVLVAVTVVNRGGSSLSIGCNNENVEPMNTVNNEDEVNGLSDGVSDDVTASSGEGYNLIKGNSMELWKKYDLNNKIKCILGTQGECNYKVDTSTGIVITVNKCEIPVIMYKDSSITSINNYYEGRANSAFEELKNKWDITNDIGELKSISYAYEMESVCTYAGNSDVLSILCKYDAIYISENSARLSSGDQYSVECLVSNNFNALTGDAITLDDIFIDAEAGKNELLTKLQELIHAEYSDSQVSEQYRSSSFDYVNGSNLAAAGLNGDQCNWYFGKSGIEIICNNLLGDEVQEYTGSIDDVKGDHKTYVIPYDELTYLKYIYKL